MSDFETLEGENDSKPLYSTLFKDITIMCKL